MRLRLICLAAAAILLQGCMTAPPAPPPDASYTTEKPSDWNARKRQLTAFDRWRLQGKMAVRHKKGTDSAIIQRWIQNGDHFRIALSSAFMGMGSVRLEGSNRFLTLTDPDGQTYQSADPQALIEKTLGWNLPVQALYYWIRGLPVPGDDHQLFFEPNGSIAYLRQHGWELNFDRHQKLTGLPEVPKSLTATRDDLRLRLVITNWQPE